MSVNILQTNKAGQIVRKESQTSLLRSQRARLLSSVKNTIESSASSMTATINSNTATSAKLKKSLTLKKADTLDDEVIIETQNEANLVQVATITKGKSFGELALLSRAKRAATIICMEDCVFAVMVKSDYEKMLGRVEQKYINESVEFLLNLPYFKKWTRHGLAKLKYFLKLEKFNKGEYVYKENAFPTHVYIVKEGEFQVNRILLFHFI